MNKNIIYGVLAVILIAAIAIGFSVFNKGENKTNSENQNQTSNSSSEETLSAVSLKDLFSSGISRKCTFSTQTPIGIANGTYYITSNNLRGDITATQDGKNVESHMIVTGNTLYTWNSAMPGQGAKIAFNASGSTSGSSSMNDKIDYKCSAWSPDQSKFAVPSGINFIDTSNILNPGNY